MIGSKMTDHLGWNLSFQVDLRLARPIQSNVTLHNSITVTMGYFEIVPILHGFGNFRRPQKPKFGPFIVHRIKHVEFESAF